MPTDAALPRGTASDTLMTQIDQDNVLAAYRVFREQAENMQITITEAAWMNDIPRCGEDVISRDAKAVFQPKIDEILHVHAAHQKEVHEAAERLREAAVQYGLIDEHVASSLRPTDRSAGGRGHTVEK